MPEDSLDKFLTRNISSVITLVASGALALGDSVFNTFSTCDLLAEVRDRQKGDGADTAIYIVVKTSYTGALRDLQRVTDYAKVLQEITGLPAYPVVAGVRIDDKIEQEVCFGSCTWRDCPPETSSRCFVSWWERLRH